MAGDGVERRGLDGLGAPPPGPPPIGPPAEPALLVFSRDLLYSSTVSMKALGSTFIFRASSHSVLARLVWLPLAPDSSMAISYSTLRASAWRPWIRRSR